MCIVHWVSKIWLHFFRFSNGFEELLICVVGSWIKYVFIAVFCWFLSQTTNKTEIEKKCQDASKLLVHESLNHHHHHYRCCRRHRLTKSNTPIEFSIVFIIVFTDSHLVGSARTRARLHTTKQTKTTKNTTILTKQALFELYWNRYGYFAKAIHFKAFNFSDVFNDMVIFLRFPFVLDHLPSVCPCTIYLRNFFCIFFVYSICIEFELFCFVFCEYVFVTAFWHQDMKTVSFCYSFPGWNFAFVCLFFFAFLAILLPIIHWKWK